MTVIPCNHPALIRLIKERRLEVLPTDDPCRFIVPSSRGVCCYEVRFTKDGFTCQCWANVNGQACRHIASVIDDQFPFIYSSWIEMERLRFQRGELTDRERKLVEREMARLEERFPVPVDPELQALFSEWEDSLCPF